MKSTIVILLFCFLSPVMVSSGRDADMIKTSKHLESLVIELGDLQIKEFSVAEMSLSAALDQAFALSGTGPKYLKGFKLDQGISDLKITLSVKNIELGILLTLIADQVSLSIKEEGGVLHFMQLQNKQASVVAIPLKKVTAEKLGLGGALSVKDALKEYGLIPLACDFSTKKNVLVLKAYDDDIDILKSLIKLLERGYKVTMK